MARKKQESKKSGKPTDAEIIKEALKPTPWIPMRTGLILVAIASIVMAVLTGIQTIPAVGWGEGLLWSLGFGGMIWVIFFGNMWLMKLFRRQ